MSMVRIIPRLDVKGQNLVKGVHLEGLRVLGLPEAFSQSYYLDGADELLYIDIVASLYGRNNLEEVVRKTARDIYIPITVGGGIRNVQDIRRLLLAGADKVAINTGAIRNPQLISEGARLFGSQCMVVSIEAIKTGNGRYQAYTDNGREPTGREVAEWARQAADLGAGEIMVTSVDQEGTGLGYDLQLLEQVCRAVKVPVIACGGAGSPEHVAQLIKHCDVNAVSAASIFHYEIIEKLGVQKRAEGNVDYLKDFHRGERSILEKFQTTGIRALKNYLAESGVPSVIYRKDYPCAAPGGPAPGGPVPAVAPPKVVVADYGRGNLFSVEKALQCVGARVLVSSRPEDVAAADKVVIAGVGSFGDGMAGLRERGLDQAIREHVNKGKPVLGICLGMQLLLEQGEEFGLHDGLGLIPGRVVKLSDAGPGGAPLRIPHIGWNRIFPPQAGEGEVELPHGAPFKGRLLQNVSPGDYFYFVHSFVCLPENPASVAACTSYGANVFCAVLAQDNLAGCQFHPERSGHLGLEIYKNFVYNS